MSFIQFILCIIILIGLAYWAQAGMPILFWNTKNTRAHLSEGRRTGGADDNSMGDRDARDARDARNRHARRFPGEIERARRALPWDRYKIAVVVLRRVRNGQFEFLLQHRSAEIWSRAGGGANEWGVISGRADAGDGWPDVTALRELQEETLANCTPQAFAAACVQAIPVTHLDMKATFQAGLPHVIYILDADRLDALGLITADWEGDPGLDPKEITYDPHPTGHKWIGEDAIDVLVHIDNTQDSQCKDSRALPEIKYLGIPIWHPVHYMFRLYRDELGRTKPVTLFHGTTEAGLAGILADGFRVDTACLSRKSKTGAPCDCGMMGAGVYFAYMDKAMSNTSRVSKQMGEDTILLRCLVDLGKCKLATASAGRGRGRDRGQGQGQGHVKKQYVDYCSGWYTEGYDSVHVRGNTVSKRSEWVVMDPARIRVEAYKRVQYQDYKLIGEGEWVIKN